MKLQESIAYNIKDANFDFLLNQTYIISYFFHILRVVHVYHSLIKEADNAFFERRFHRAKLTPLVFEDLLFIYPCHGNIDFSKIAIMVNFTQTR